MGLFTRLGCLAAIGTALLCSGVASAAPIEGAAQGVTIDWDPGSGREGAIWMAYLVARANFIDGHMSLYEQTPGVITPTFDEEVAARTAVVAVYRELQEKDKGLVVAYFDDLALAVDNSFIREYVWTYLRQPTWELVPSGLRLDAFGSWRAGHLDQHQPVTHGSIRFTGAAKTEPKNSEAPSNEFTLVVEGRKTLQNGNPQRAMSEYFDKVIDQFERKYRGANKRVYSAHNQMQVFLYLGLPNDSKQPVEVLDSVWADAYLLKAYALTELKRLKDAQRELERAIELSPMTSQYVSELAYTYQAAGDCNKSIATYAQAAAVAELGSDDQSKTGDLTRAWRGQGYCLVEQGRLNDAEALYRKCLALDPSDAKASGELEYIASRRKR